MMEIKDGRVVFHDDVTLTDIAITRCDILVEGDTTVSLGEGATVVDCYTMAFGPRDKDKPVFYIKDPTADVSGINIDVGP